MLSIFSFFYSIVLQVHVISLIVFSRFFGSHFGVRKRVLQLVQCTEATKLFQLNNKTCFNTISFLFTNVYVCCLLFAYCTWLKPECADFVVERSKCLLFVYDFCIRCLFSR